MHICQTRRTLMMVKPPPPYSFLPQSLVHFLFLCLFSTFSIFNRPWENFSRDQEEKSALIATGSVDWNLGRFPLLNWACQLWPALPQGSWRSSALWQSLRCSTPTPPLGSDTKNQGCRFLLILMTWWGTHHEVNKVGVFSKWELLPVFSSYHCRLLEAIIH